MAMMIVVASFVILISFCVTGGKAEECQPPTGVMAETVGTDAVHVTWELPPASPCRIGFSISFTPERGGRTLSTGAGTSSAYECIIGGLDCNTAYIFTVGSIAAQGMTAPQSKEIRVLVGGPRNFSATAISSTSVHLTWEPPASPCDESITGYEVMYTCSECGMSGNGSSPASLTGVEYTFDHLEEDTEYQFRVRAAGKDFTDPVSVKTFTGGTGVVTENTNTSSESLGPGEITVTLLVTAEKPVSRTSSAGHTTGEHLPTPTNRSPTASDVMPEQQCSSCWPVAGGVISVTVVVETVIVTVLTTVILYLWRSHHKLKQQQIKRSPDIAVMECAAYGEIKPEPPHEAIYEEPQ